MVGGTRAQPAATQRGGHVRATAAYARDCSGVCDVVRAGAQGHQAGAGHAGHLAQVGPQGHRQGLGRGQSLSVACM
jgi:hypothetical protein